MRNQLLTLAAAVALSACAGTPDPVADASVAGGEQLICTREYPTGSHLPKRVCRTKAQIEEDERTARMLETRMQDKKPFRERQAGGN